MTTGAAARAGVVSALAAMASGHLAASLIAPAASPVLGVASAVVDATPTPVKEWAVSTFGTADKAVLIGSVLIVTAALAAAAGLVARRWRSAGLVVVGLLGALAAAAAAARPASTPVDLIPSVLAGIVGIAVLSHLTRRTAPPRVESPLDHTAYATGAPATPRRRSVLTGAGGIGLASLGVGGLGQVLMPKDPAAGFALPAPATRLGAVPTGLESTVPEVTALQTPVATFYRIDTALRVPHVDLESWRLTIDGLVDRTVTFSFADILAMGLREADITLNCVSNEVGGSYIGNQRWTGVLVRDLLARAGVQASAEQVLSTSVDGMTISTPVEALTDDRGALLAVGMGGAPLTALHGFPARLITPGLYGYVGATKWVERLTLTTYAARQAYWTERGWAERAEVKTQCRIDTPRQEAQAGTVAIGGVAWSQARGGISRVEVQVDDGPWQAATLGPSLGAASWRQWHLPWQATSGQHTIAARAADGSGELQTSAVAEPFPDGAAGYHQVSIRVP